jgi:hypothetical protein
MACTTNTFIWLVKGDTRPILQLTCKTDDPEIVDLSGCSVFFTFRKAGSTIAKFKKSCTIVDAVAGIATYTWAPGDLDTVGDFNGEVEVVFPGGKIQTSKLIHFKVRNSLD